MITNYSRPTGFGLVETIVAMAIFITFAASGIFGVLGSFSLNRLGNENTQATLLAQEGVDAVRSIKKQSWSHLTAGSYGLSSVGGTWSFTSPPDTIGKYTRLIDLSVASRDSGGSLVAIGGAADPDTFLVSSKVLWDFSPTRNNSVGTTLYITNWEKPILTSGVGGMLVYADSQVTPDGCLYRLLDASGNWGIASTVADIDPSTSDRVLYVARLYPSATRNEKILLSRHFNGTSQYIYAQVFDGVTWSDVTLLTSWAATTYTDTQKFDGTYLSNGDFVVLYTDNTTTPKMRVWNGSAWGSAISTRVVGGVPNFIITKARPGTNEIMAAFFDQSSDTNTQYFNGGAYQTSNWTLHTEHASAAPSAAKWLVDFAWSPFTPTQGLLIYSTSTSDKTITSKVWTANGSGSGSWGTVADSAATAGNLGAMNVESRSAAADFLSCQKNANSDLYCYKFGLADSWSTPANNLLTATNYSGNPRSFHLGFEKDGALGLVVYSDNTSTPKYRKYDPVPNSFDVSASGLASTTNIISTVRQVSHPATNDIMVLFANTALDVYTAVWDGTGDVFYTSTGKAQTQQGISGSSALSFWYDFTYDAN
ncbi:MAG: type II secretion system protein [Candidatus Shapirobacteria bacterium]